MINPLKLVLEKVICWNYIITLENWAESRVKVQILFVYPDFPKYVWAYLLVANVGKPYFL